MGASAEDGSPEVAPVAGDYGARASTSPFPVPKRRADDENETAKTKPGYGNRGKTNCVFPPVPQPLLLLTNYDKKQRPENNYDRLHKIPCASREFLRDARDTIDNLSSNPLIYQVRSRRHQVRWGFPHRFPYRIIFRVIGDLWSYTPSFMPRVKTAFGNRAYAYKMYASQSTRAFPTLRVRGTVMLGWPAS